MSAHCLDGICHRPAGERANMSASGSHPARERASTWTPQTPQERPLATTLQGSTWTAQTPQRRHLATPLHGDAQAHGLCKRAQRQPLATTSRGNAQALCRLRIDGIWPPPCMGKHQHAGSADATTMASGRHPAKQSRIAGHVALHGPIVSPLRPPKMPLTRSGAAMMRRDAALIFDDAARRGPDRPRRVPSHRAAGPIQRRVATSTDRLGVSSPHGGRSAP